MELQLQPNCWSCYPTALAMCLDKPVAEVIKELGHDGGEILFPWEPAPFCFRGFADREIIDYAWANGYYMCLIPGHNFAVCRGELYKLPTVGNPTRISVTLRLHKCIINSDMPKAHALACDTNQIFDPRGKVSPIGELDLEKINWISALIPR